MVHAYDELTVKETAQVLGIKPNSVRKAIIRDSLKAEKRGRDYFILRKEIDRYREENRRA